MNLTDEFSRIAWPVGMRMKDFLTWITKTGRLRLSVGSTVLTAWALGLNEERDLAVFIPSALDDGYGLSNPLKSCCGDVPAGMDSNQGM